MKSVIWFARVSIFIVYFWFGFLKIIGTSPAESLVHELFNITLNVLISFKAFVITFGVIECTIGLMWLVPKLTLVAYFAVIVHVIFTFVPMIALTQLTWSNILTPTMTGQYILKNLLLLSCTMMIKEHNKAL